MTDDASAPDYMMVLTTLKANGGGAVALVFARALVDRGATVRIYTSRFHGVGPLSAPENGGLRFVTTAPVLGSPALSMAWLFTVALFASLLRRSTLIYTHCATALVPSFSRRRPVWLMQDVDYAFLSGPMRAALRVLFLRAARASAIVTTNARLERFLRRVGYECAFVGDLGISRAWEQRCRHQSRDLDVLLIAKPGRHKAGIRTRDMAIRLAERGARACLIDQLPGPNPGYPASLTVLPPVSAAEMQDLMQRSRCFVCLSVREGYGLPPLEALASGCAVLTTRIPSVRALEHPRLQRIMRSLTDEDLVHAVEQTLAAPADEDRPYDGPWTDDWARRAAARTLELASDART